MEMEMEFKLSSDENMVKRSKNFVHYDKDDYINKMIQKYKDDETILDYMLNIVLVYGGARKATLIEEANYGFAKDKTFDEKYDDVKDLKSFIQKLDLICIPEEPTRFLVVKKNTDVDYDKDGNIDVGKTLGFYCYDHEDFDNIYVDRISGSIYVDRISGSIYSEDSSINIYSEVCVMEKITISKLENHINDLVKKFNSVLNKYGFKTYSLIKNIRSPFTIREILQNDSFDPIKEIIFEIRNWFYNASLPYMTEFVSEMNKYDWIKYKNFIRKMFELYVLEQDYIDIMWDTTDFDIFSSKSKEIESIEKELFDMAKNTPGFPKSEKDTKIIISKLNPYLFHTKYEQKN